jgi:dTDP-4-amino-4,6-dideoxygalactose transaminase
MEKKQIGFGDWYPAPNLKKYLNDIIKTRRLTYGRYSERLEKLFSEKNGVKHSIFCSSGTSALYTALGVLKNENPRMLPKRNKVILPATTFISDYNVVVMQGFTPVFVDVAPTYNISYTDLENTLKAHSNEIFAVMPSSLMGRPIDGKRVKELIDTWSPGAFFILDSCENISSTYNNEYPEQYADFTCWSTYISHLLVAGAVGGFIGTNDSKLAIKARSFINHGRHPDYTSIDDDNDVDEAKLKDITANRFKFIQNGLNFRMGEIEAAFALSMLEDNFDDQLQKRKENALGLISGLKKFPLVLPIFNPKEEVRHMMLPIRVLDSSKKRLVDHLELNGVETREVLPMYQPITEHFFGKELMFRTNFPMAWEIYDKAFYIGCHQFLTQDDIEYIIATFEKFYNK